MKPATLISADELAALLDAALPLVLDCRSELGTPQGGRAAYASAHVPGALHADLDTDLSDLSKKERGRHPLPDAEAFAAVLARWGWYPGRAVVAYDAAGGALAAARMWWMMRLVGAMDVRVLDGGFPAWLAAGHPTSAALPTVAASRISVTFDRTQLVGFDDLEKGVAESSLRLLDARGEARYRGDVEPLDRVAGHVPGALNRPYTDNLDERGFFKAAKRLAAEFSPLIAPYAPPAVVHMCGSGVTACHNLLAMEHAGLGGSRLFAPSWSGWISDATRPVRIGAQP